MRLPHGNCHAVENHGDGVHPKSSNGQSQAMVEEANDEPQHGSTIADRRTQAARQMLQRPTRDQAEGESYGKQHLT